MARHHLMTSVKNEAVYLIEWIAHHKAVGFDQIFVTANNCSDGTMKVLRKLKQHDFIQFAENKCPPDKIPQHEGYKLLRERFDVDACDWLMIMDVDEFLHVEAGDGLVGDLTDQGGDDVDIIALNALTFGTGPDPENAAPVTERFQYRLPEKHAHNCSIKSITRNPSRFLSAHNHHLMKLDPPAPLTVMRGDGTQFVIPAEMKKLWSILRHAPLDDVGHTLAHYNHYSIKSIAEYGLRQQRGNGAEPLGSTPKQRYSDMYFLKRADADIHDVRIEKYAPKKREWMSAMLAIPAIKEVQDEVEKKFLARIAKINGTAHRSL